MLKRIVLFFTLLPVCAAFAQNDATPYLNPPRIVKNPADYYRYSVDSRRFSGIPSLAVAGNGRLWATWYAGSTPDEDVNNYVVLATSGTQGDCWEELLVVDPDGNGPVRAYDPELWIDPDGRLWFFWTQTIAHDGTVAGVWCMVNETPDDANATWSEPRRLADGVMMCKPTVLSNGEWLLPISTWRLTDNSAKVYVSKDKGKTFTLRGAAHVPRPYREFDEHIIVEKRDGSLWMIVRTEYGIGESFSSDKGKTWTEVTPSPFAHTSARFFIRRLASGNLLFVKHGPVDVATERCYMMAFLSKDDGKTWSKGLLIDARDHVSYPDGQQTEDGRIHLIYDYDRTGAQMILYTTFTEEDILSPDYDKKMIELYNRRRTVSQKL
jgi:hypothetical protein